MLSINRRLGFRRYRKGVSVQITLEDPEAYLQGRSPETRQG